MPPLSVLLRAPISAVPAAGAIGRSDTASVARRHVVESLLAGLLVALVVLAWRTPPELLAPGVFRDDGVYLAVGRALSEGRGYHSFYLPGAPLQVKYPPGLPALYAVLWALFGALHTVYAAAGILSLLATASAGAVVWYLARARLGLSPIVALPLAVGPFLLDSAIQYYSLPISESWYALLWGLVSLVAVRVCDESNERSLRDAIVLGVLIAVAMLIRSQALALFVAAIPALFFARRRREALITALVAGLPIVAWQLFLAAERARGATLSTLPDESGYVSFVGGRSPFQALRFTAANFWLNIQLYVDEFAPNLNPSYVLGGIILLTIILLAGIGGWRIGRRRLILPLTVAASGGLTLLWPWTQDRLLMPLLPFAGLLAAMTLQQIGARLSRAGRLAGAAVIALVTLGAAFQQITFRAKTYQAYAADQVPEHMSPTWYLPHNSRVLMLESMWIAKHARPDDKLLASSPAGLYLSTGLPGLSSSPAESRLAAPVFGVPGRFLSRAIRDGGVSLVVVEAPDDLNRDVTVIQRACPGAFHMDAQGTGGWPMFLRVVDPVCIARAFQ